MTDDKVTIRVSKINRKRLNKIAGDMRGKTGQMATANDAIDYLFLLAETVDKKDKLEMVE